MLGPCPQANVGTCLLVHCVRVQGQGGEAADGALQPILCSRFHTCRAKVLQCAYRLRNKFWRAHGGMETLRQVCTVHHLRGLQVSTREGKHQAMALSSLSTKLGVDRIIQVLGHVQPPLTASQGLVLPATVSFLSCPCLISPCALQCLRRLPLTPYCPTGLASRLLPSASSASRPLESKQACLITTFCSSWNVSIAPPPHGTFPAGAAGARLLRAVCGA